MSQGLPKHRILDLLRTTNFTAVTPQMLNSAPVVTNPILPMPTERTFPLPFLQALQRVRMGGKCNVYDRPCVTQRLSIPDRWKLKLLCPGVDEYLRALNEMAVFAPWHPPSNKKLSKSRRKQRQVERGGASSPPGAPSRRR